jgi:hypothetical protein
MSNILTWVNSTGYMDNGVVKGTLAVKPSFTFVYDSLYYEPDDNNLFYFVGNTKNLLSVSELAEVTNYLTLSTGDDLLVQGVDAAGNYIGFKAKSQVAAVVVSPPPTSDPWLWDFTNNIYVASPKVDTRTLTQKQDDIWALIKSRRDAMSNGGVLVGTYWFNTDANSRIRYLGLKDKARDMLMAGGTMTDNITVFGNPVQWKTMDNTFAIITAQLAYDIVNSISNFDATNFSVAETHKAAMIAAADPLTYDFSTNWPATFTPVI